MSRTVTWHIGGTTYETAVECDGCPFCGVEALTELPAPIREKQQDQTTTHVCLHLIGGCNQGFRKGGCP